MSKLATSLVGMRDLPDEELRQRLRTTRDELFRLHLGQYTNQVTSSALLSTKRRDIARIMTILRGRELGIDKQAQKASTEATAEAAPETKTKKTKAKKAKS